MILELGEHRIKIEDNNNNLLIEVERHEPSSESKVCVVNILKKEYDGDGVNDVIFTGHLTSTDKDKLDITVLSKDLNDNDITVFEDTFEKGDYVR